MPAAKRQKEVHREKRRPHRANVPEQTCLPKAVSQRDPFEEEGGNQVVNQVPW